MADHIFNNKTQHNTHNSRYFEANRSGTTECKDASHATRVRNNEQLTGCLPKVGDLDLCVGAPSSASAGYVQKQMLTSVALLSMGSVMFIFVTTDSYVKW